MTTIYKILVILFLLVSSNLFAQTTVTYYFDSWNASNWDSNEDNIIDGSTSTQGSDNDDNHYVYLDGNTCTGTNLGTISKVELRAYFNNDYDGNSSSTIAPRLIPFFGGSSQGIDYDYPNGDYDGTGFPAWGSYFDITSDANAPATWSWSDVQDLDCRLVSNRPNSGQHKVYKIEMQVTYSNCSSSAYAWTGATNSNWNNSGNWYGGSVPTSTSDVTIPSTCVTNWPTLNVNANCRNLTIESGAQLSCSSYNLNVYGDWTNNGVFNANTSSVYFKGSTNTSLAINGSSTTILNEGFESGTSGWSLGSLTGHAEWRRQSGAANTGTWDCALYDIGNSSAHDFPRTGANGYVDLSRNIDLSDYASASITYQWRSDGNDRTYPLLSFDGTVLDDENMYEGGSSWHTETYDLSSFCGDYDNYMFFRMWVGADVGGSAPGLCIDDIIITGTENVQRFYNVYFEKTGGSTMSLASSINVSNDITISSGTLNTAGYNITIAGDFTNNGTYTSGNGIAKFNGSSTQNILGSSNTSFYNFIKNSSADLILNGNSTTITASNSFTWIDNDDKISVNGTTMSFVINDDVLVNMGCELDVIGGSTISIAKNFQNLGTIDLTTGNSILKFHSSINSYVLTEPGDTIFSDDFETDPFAGSSNWVITNPSGRSEFRWSNGQQHSGAKDLAVWDNLGSGFPYDYQWGAPSDGCSSDISIDLTNYTGAILEFWYKCGGDDPAQAGYDGDFGQVFVNGVAITNKLWGQQSYRKHNPVSLADYAGQVITLSFRFSQDGQWSGGHASSPGLCIDDVLIYANSIQVLNVHDLVVVKDNNTTSTVIICPIDASNDITITQGILDASGNNIDIEGDWYNAVGTQFLARHDTVFFDGSTNQAVDIASSSFGNLFVDKSGSTLNVSNNTLDIDEELKIYSGATLKANGQNIELGGNWNNNGNFIHDNNTVKFDNISSVNTYGTSAGKRFYNVELDGTTATLQNDIWIENNFRITGGTWDVSTSNREMTVFGDWYSDGAFTQRSGNVNLRGSGSSVYLNSGSSTVPTNAFEDDFETDKGWTLTGLFARGTPMGGSGSHGNPDPSSAYNGTNILGENLNGGYTNSMSDRQDAAVSPTIDCSNHSNCHLSFERWLGVENSSYDHAYIDISTNGGVSWTNIWANSSSTIDESAWGTQDIDISSYADGQSQVKIRFALGSTDGSWQYCGWNIDDFKVYGDEAVVLVGEYYNLTINKSASTNDVICLSNFNVDNNLTMVIGKIDLKDKTIDLGTTGTLIGETNENRILATDGGGTEGAGTGTITARRTSPSGDIAGLGCEITPSSNMGVTDIVRGHLLHTDIDGFGHASIFRYFDVSPANNSGLNATFRFNYFADELHGQTETELEQWRSTDGGTSWINRNGTVNTGNDYVELTGIDAFSRWTLSGKDFPLPIELLEQNVSCIDNGAKIEWVTSSETNNDYFSIERSIDGYNFEEIGQVYGAGNSNEVLNYYFVDDNLQQEFYYYRLRQTDYNGVNTSADILTSTCASLKTKPVINVEYHDSYINTVLNNIDGEFTIVLGTMSGKIIKTTKQESVNGKLVYKVNKSELNEAMYYVSFKSNNEYYIKKIVIKH